MPAPITNGDPGRDEPDIRCTLKGAPHLFELGRLLAEEIPKNTVKATKSLHAGGSGVAGGAVTPWGDVLMRMLRTKIGKHYETGGEPVSLALYYDNEWPKTWAFPPPGDFGPWAKAYVEPEIAKGTGAFTHISVYDRNAVTVLWAH